MMKNHQEMVASLDLIEDEAGEPSFRPHSHRDCLAHQYKRKEDGDAGEELVHEANDEQWKSPSARDSKRSVKFQLLQFEHVHGFQDNTWL